MTCLTGNVWETVADAAVSGRGRNLNAERTYNALDAATGPGRLGYGWSDSYGAHLVVARTGGVTVVQGNGSTLPFAQNGTGGYSASGWVTAALSKAADGSFTVAYRNQTTDTYDPSGRLSALSDRNGYQTTLAYASGRLSTVTDPAGRTLSYGYNAAGLVSTLTDPMGRVTHYEYDPNQNLTSVTDPGGGITRYGYDASHRMTSDTDANGGTTTNSFDSHGRVVTQVDPMNRTTTFDYSGVLDFGSGPAGKTVITNPAGDVRVLRFNSEGALTTKTLGFGTAQEATWRYGVDRNTGEMVRVTDPNGHATTMTWDTRGSLLTRTDPLGHTASWTYTAANDPATATDPIGNQTRYTYDSHGNLATVSATLDTTGQTATTTYEHADPIHPGDVTKVTDPSGRFHTIGYDHDGNPADVTDGLGNRGHKTFNGDGWLTGLTTPRGTASGANPVPFTTVYTYNERGQVVRADGPSGQTMQYVYDAVGNVTKTTDGNGHVTKYDYDADNEPTTLTRPDLSTEVTNYNPAGEFVGQVDGLNKTTTYGYDALGRRTSATDPLGRTTLFGYDPAGNLASMTDPLSRVTTYGYDDANRRTAVTYSDNLTPNVAFGYNDAGQRTSMTDGTGTTTWTYDSLHRLTSSTPGSASSYALAYGYDLAGNVTELTYTGLAAHVTKTYNAASQMVTVADPKGNTTGFDYNPDGALTTIRYPNGVTSSRTYNNADQVIQIRDITPPSGTLNTGSVLVNLPYTRDSDGLLATQNPTGVPTPTIHGVDPADSLVVPEGIDRDPNDRVAGAHLLQPTNPPVETYGYDAGDNLTSRSTGAVTDSLSYDVSHELTSVTRSTMAAGYTYDSLGERIGSVTKDGSGHQISDSSYVYDQAGHLTGYAGAPLQILSDQSGTPRHLSYQYDGLGRRSGLTWDPVEGHVPLIVADGLNIFITGPSGLAVEQLSVANTANVQVNGGYPTAGTGAIYLHSDQLGSTRVVTDDHANPLISFTYDAYGRTTEKPLVKLTGLGLTAGVTPIQYAGSYTDLLSGLIYLRARWYDPTTANFLTRDRLESQTRQPYAYAIDNPIDNTDPTGDATSGECLGGLLGAIRLIDVAFCVVADDQGNVGWTFTHGLVWGSPYAGLNVQSQLSNGADICDLGGAFTIVGGSAEIVTGGLAFGSSPDGDVYLFEEGVATPSPIPGEGHFGGTTTSVHAFPFISILRWLLGE